MIFKILPAVALFCTLATAQTLSLVKGNGQLVLYGPGVGSQPIEFSVMNGTTPVPGATITLTNANGTPTSAFSSGLSAGVSSITTNAQGIASIVFVPPFLSSYSSAQFEFAAHYGTQSIDFWETEATFPPLSVVLTNPTPASLISSPYQASVGTPGTPIEVNVNGGGFPGPLENVAVRAVVIQRGAPAGTPLESVSCLEGAADPEGNVYTASNGSLPAGTAKCTPIFTLPSQSLNPNYDTGQFEIVVGDTDIFGPFLYNVLPAPLGISAPSVLSGNSMQMFASSFTATGGVPPYTFTLASGSTLPTGIMLGSNGQLTGSTSQAGQFTFSVQLKDSTGATKVGGPYDLTINGGPVALAPSKLPDPVVGVPYNQVVTVSGGVPPYAISVTGTLPTGLTATAAANSTTLTISGTATAATYSPIAVVVKDATGAIADVPLASFQAVSPLAFAKSATLVAVQGTAFSQAVTLAGGAPPYTFMATGLPQGLTIGATTGLISGTASAMPGMYTATITGGDSNGTSVTEAVMLDVSGGAIGLAAGSTPSAVAAGSTFSQQLAVVGGVPPYAKYTLSPGTDQNVAISSTGVLSGSITAAGNQQVIFTVSDSVGNVSMPLSVSVPVYPSFMASSITNAASFAAGAVAPGEIVSIFGVGLGPDKGVAATLDANNFIPTKVGNTTVTFGTFEAPILFAGNGQLNVIVPFELAGQTTTELTITAAGQASPPLTLNVAPSAPGIFKFGTGSDNQAAVLNQDLSANGTANAAKAGSVVVIYATGGGALSAMIADGSLAPSSPLIDIADVSVTIGGQPATVNFAGLAPSFAGLIQINAVVPTGLSGSAEPLVVNIGTGTSSAETATIAVQ